TNPETPPERLALFAFLLGACGGEQDATLLKKMLEDPSENARRASSGILAGYISLKPKEGWERLFAVAGDEKKPFLSRMAALNAVQFFHLTKPVEARSQIIAALKQFLPHGDIADMAVENLRRWQIWDLTADVLALFDRKSHNAPIMHKTIVRYAVGCPKPE